MEIPHSLMWVLPGSRVAKHLWRMILSSRSRDLSLMCVSYLWQLGKPCLKGYCANYFTEWIRLETSAFTSSSKVLFPPLSADVIDGCPQLPIFWMIECLLHSFAVDTNRFPAQQPFDRCFLLSKALRV